MAMGKCFIHFHFVSLSHFVIGKGFTLSHFVSHAHFVMAIVGSLKSFGGIKEYFRKKISITLKLSFHQVILFEFGFVGQRRGKLNTRNAN
jgi:hypothetical protein